MNKSIRNFWLDGMLFIALLGVLISSLVIDNKDPNLLVWGLTRPNWVVTHIVSAVTMLAGSTLHLVLHWKWIVTTARRALIPGSSVKTTLAEE